MVGCVAVGSSDFREALGLFCGKHGMVVGPGIHDPPLPHVPGGTMVYCKGCGEGHQFEDAGGAEREVLCNLAEVYQRLWSALTSFL